VTSSLLITILQTLFVVLKNVPTRLRFVKWFVILITFGIAPNHKQPLLLQGFHEQAYGRRYKVANNCPSYLNVYVIMDDIA
jgi:hypothetical protein